MRRSANRGRGCDQLEQVTIRTVRPKSHDRGAHVFDRVKVVLHHGGEYTCVLRPVRLTPAARLLFESASTLRVSNFWLGLSS